MSNIRSISFDFTANSQSSDSLRVGRGQKLVFGSFGGNATISLRALAVDGATWVPVRYPNTATAAEFATTTVGEVCLDVAPGTYRMTTTAFTSAKTGYLRTDD